MIKKIKIFLNKKQQAYFLLLLAGIFIAALLEMIGIGSIPVFISLLLNPEQLLSYLPQNDFVNFISNKNYTDQILIVAIALSSFFIFKNIFIFTVSYFQASIYRNLKIENSRRLFQSYLNSPYSFHLDRNPAIITRNITGDLEKAASHIICLMNLTREILLIIVITVLLLLANPASSIIAFMIIGFLATIFYLFVRKKMTELSKNAQYNRGRQVQLVNQVFGAIKDAKILAREPYFINEFKNETKGAEKDNFFFEIVSKIPRLSMEIFAVITILLVTLLSIMSGGVIDKMLPMLGLLGIATIRIIPSFQSITTILTYMRRSLVSFNLIVDELTKLEKYNYKKNSSIKTQKNGEISLKNNIELKNISYEYPNSNKNVLKNISFKIKSGSYVGIIGKTGSGKSTLVDIILGLLEPTDGKILSDSHNINKNFSMWQKKIGYIPQDIYLIDDTIKRNIAFGLPDRDIEDDRVKLSLKLAQLSDFVSDLPNGLNTTVGNRGIRLSGGQRQRIGVARSLYRKFDLLILDEATSALDVETEKKLIQDIEGLRHDFTLITVTHRLSAIKNCDEVFLLSDGKLVDNGNIDQLILRNEELRAGN